MFYIYELVVRISPGKGDIQVQRWSDINWLQASPSHHETWRGCVSTISWLLPTNTNDPGSLAWHATGEPLMVLNATELILKDQGCHLDSFRFNLVSFRKLLKIHSDWFILWSNLFTKKTQNRTWVETILVKTPHCPQTRNWQSTFLEALYTDWTLQKAKPRRQMHFCHKDTKMAWKC